MREEESAGRGLSKLLLPLSQLISRVRLVGTSRAEGGVLCPNQVRTVTAYQILVTTQS